MTDGLRAIITMTASENRVKRKLLTLCRSMASFITTNAMPHAADTERSAHGARRILSACEELIHATSLREQFPHHVQVPCLEFQESMGRLQQLDVKAAL
mgnify:CR=1 FL=1